MTIRELIEALEEIAKRTPMGLDQKMNVERVVYTEVSGEVEVM